LIPLNAGTVLLQWATGGLLFLWVTTRRGQAGPGYSWLLKGVYAALAIGAALAGRPAGWAVAAVALLTLSRRRPTWTDLIPPAIGAVSLVVGSVSALDLARTIIGAAFLGVISDAMLLGHWYLVQPKLGRDPLNELIKWVVIIWPFEVGAMLWPRGMFSVFTGSIDDSYGGMLGWFWIACALATIILAVVTIAALKERAYSAVMAATGLLYLAILTAFGTDLVARALLA
jgi:hypothetical protein